MHDDGICNPFAPLSEYAREFNDDIIVLSSRDKPVAAKVSLMKVDEESFQMSAHQGSMELLVIS